MNEEIVVKFGADTSALGQTMRKLEPGIKSWAKQVAGYVGGIFAAQSAINGAQRLISYIDRLGDQAQNLKVSTDFLQGFYRSVVVAGGNSEKAASALDKFFSKIGDGDKSFQHFGISLRDQSGVLRRNEDILGDVAEALATADNGARRAAIGVAFFGKQWADISIALQGGRDAVKAMGESSIFKIDPAVIEQMNMLKDSITGAGVGLTGLLGNLMAFTFGGLVAGLSGGLGSVFGSGTFLEGLEGVYNGVKKVNDTGGLKILSDEQVKALEKMEEILVKALVNYDKAKFDAASKEEQIRLLKEERDANEKNLKALEAIAKNEFAQKSSGFDRSVLVAKTGILEANRKILALEKEITDETLRKVKAEDEAFKKLKQAQKEKLDQFRPTLSDLAENKGPMQADARRAEKMKDDIRKAFIKGDAKRAEDLTKQLYGGEGDPMGKTPGQQSYFDKIRDAQNAFRKKVGLPEIKDPRRVDGLLGDLAKKGMKPESVQEEIQLLREKLLEVLKHEGIAVKGA